MMSSKNQSYPTLQIIKELFYDRLGIEFKNLKLHAESSEYEACTFELNEKVIEHRTSKITLTKTGQFVTIWKRNKEGITEPFNFSDEFDFIIISSKCDKHLGQFIFPKSVLVEKAVITHNKKPGKRGIRVYPPWDAVNNKQAEKTQAWQLHYFVEVSDTAANVTLIKKLLSLG